MFTVDFSGILNTAIGEKDGVTLRELEYFREHFKDVIAEFTAERSRFGFCQIIRNKKTVDEGRRIYEHYRDFEHIAVLGIGGSALGAQAIAAIVPPSARNHTVHILDNIDPFTLKETFDSLDFTKTLFLVISKSGETIETLSQFLFCFAKVRDAGLDPGKHFIFITDPNKGFLRELAAKESFATLDVPQEVGGRFSVLSHVGLMPAWFMGVDVLSLIKGARTIDKNCMDHVVSFSLFLYLLNMRRGKTNLIMMPYCDRLGMFASWFSQLWAESLGKKNGISGEILRTGQTPIVARGATDQHSQLQLYLEGPRDKAVILLKSRDLINLPIPDIYRGHASVDYLGGKTFDRLFESEYMGTKGALLHENVPVMTIELNRADSTALGALFYFFELATAFSGKLYGINPFDQPGVETGKKIAFNLMGKKGFEADKPHQADASGEYAFTCH